MCTVIRKNTFFFHIDNVLKFLFLFRRILNTSHTSHSGLRTFFSFRLSSLLDKSDCDTWFSIEFSNRNVHYGSERVSIHHRFVRRTIDVAVYDRPTFVAYINYMNIVYAYCSPNFRAEPSLAVQLITGFGFKRRTITQCLPKTEVGHSLQTFVLVSRKTGPKIEINTIHPAQWKIS